VKGCRLKPLPVKTPQNAECSAAQVEGPVQERLEHRGEIAGRGIDDLQYLGGRSLLSERLVALGCTLGKPPL
jgi:hypothetical protein